MQLKPGTVKFLADFFMPRRWKWVEGAMYCSICGQKRGYCDRDCMADEISHEIREQKLRKEEANERKQR